MRVLYTLLALREKIATASGGLLPDRFAGLLT